MSDVNETGTEKQSVYQMLLDQAEHGDPLVDPLEGKHEAAVLSDVDITTSGEFTSLVLTWSGLVNNEGMEVEHEDRNFMPTNETHNIGKINWMQKLKALGVVPESSKEVLLFPNAESQQVLLQALTDQAVGKEFPLTIALDSRGFLKTTVRRRKKSQQ